MDIQFKTKEVEININNVDKEAIHNEKEMKSIIEIIELFRSFTTNEVKTLVSDKATANTIREKVSPKNKDTVQIRGKERLPNVVMLSDLAIKKAVTENPMIRCPECGQTDKVIVNVSDNENYFMKKRNIKGKEEYIPIMLLSDKEQIDNICLPEGDDPVDNMQAYNYDLSRIKIPKSLKNVDINVSYETQITCPICRAKNKFELWKNAFDNPLEFGFETELLCDMCGKEAVDVVTEDKRHIIRCEHCGYEKDVV